MSAASSDPLSIDVEALGDWLSKRSPAFRKPISAKRFEGGQSNPTYLLRCDERQFVLRKKPPGPLLRSAHQIEREHRVISALHAAGFPVPTPTLLCEDAAVVGTSFYMMDFVAGRIFWDPAMPDCSAVERTLLYEAMGATLARLHTFDWRGAGLVDFGRPDNYIARQIVRWTRQYESTSVRPSQRMNQLIEWLGANIPDDDASGDGALVHGDFRVDNMIFHPTEPRVLAVLDWELATIGHPIADLAYNCLPWRLPAAMKARSLGGLNLKALGIPDEQTYVEAYCRRVGRQTIDNWRFFVAFSAFRVAAILTGVLARARQGNAASSNAEEVGALADIYADAGWEAAFGR